MRNFHPVLAASALSWNPALRSHRYAFVQKRNETAIAPIKIRSSEPLAPLHSVASAVIILLSSLLSSLAGRQSEVRFTLDEDGFLKSKLPGRNKAVSVSNLQFNVFFNLSLTSGRISPPPTLNSRIYSRIASLGFHVSVNRVSSVLCLSAAMEDFVEARKKLDKQFVPVWSHDVYDDSSAELTILELCYHADTTKYGCQTHDVPLGSLKQWLNSNHECPLGTNHHVTLQLALVETDWGYPNIRSSISKASLNLIINEFKVSAVHEYFGMIKDESFVIQQDQKEDKVGSLLIYGIKLWNYVILQASYNYSRGRTQAIAWAREGGLHDIRCILESHNGSAAHNSFYAAIAALRLIEHAQEVIIGAEHVKILGMERKTGYDSHTKTIDEEAQGDLRKLSADITGIKSLLARHEKELKFSTNTLNTIGRYLQDCNIRREEVNKSDSRRDLGTATTNQIITILHNRMENLALDIGENKTRVDAQVTAVRSLD
jgi:hypothetical protein